MWTDDRDQPREPVAEPEILPPERPQAHQARPDDFWVRQRIVIAQPGPVGMVLGLLALGAVAAIGIVAFLGFFLLLVPVIGVMVAAFILAALLRGPRRL